MTGQHSDADDVAQEALVRAYRGLPSFDGRADFYTWLHRIVINVALNHLRARRRSRQVPILDDAAVAEQIPVPTGDAAHEAESRELVRVVFRALGELSPSLRVTLILATVEEMPYKEIAAALSIPEGTVAWRVNQARKLLRIRLAALSPEAVPDMGNMDDVLRRTKAALGAP
jgi:RNA polymerase sigma-70 factor (ECF subfamily)